MSLRAADTVSPAGTQRRHGAEVPGSAPGASPLKSDAQRAHEQLTHEQHAAFLGWVETVEWGFDNRAFVAGNAAAFRIWARACELHLLQAGPVGPEELSALCRDMLLRLWQRDRADSAAAFGEWYEAASAAAQHCPRFSTPGASRETMRAIEAARFEDPVVLRGFLEQEQARLERERQQPPGPGYRLGRGFQGAVPCLDRNGDRRHYRSPGSRRNLAAKRGLGLGVDSTQIGKRARA